MSRHDILVLGGGPAGAVAAMGLAAAGHAVALVAAPRPFDAIEGLSERAVEALGFAGCGGALDRLGPEARRVATWNGETNDANRERLVERQAFDAALLGDAEAVGVAVYRGRAGSLQEGEGGWRLSYRPAEGGEATLEAGFLVEARGRASPSEGHGLRGPATTALSRRWCGDGKGEAGTAVAAFEEGWCWNTQAPDGSALLQIMVASPAGALPPRRGLGDHYMALVRRIPEARDWLGAARPVGQVQARSAAPMSADGVLGPRYARVGDAAFAVDPLSGNGVFQAVAVALALPAVVNTVLSRPADRDLAQAFYRQRVSETFLRMSRVGRDFYRSEERWADRPFWRQRRDWPDDVPAHARPGDGQPYLAERPVSEAGYIVRREVIVTPDHPRGVWRVSDVALLPLMEHLLNCGAAALPEAAAAVAEAGGHPVEAVETALAWLLHRGLLERDGATARLSPAAAAQLAERLQSG